MKLKSKTLEMQLLYETKAEESLLSSLENFRHFLNNNNLIPAGPKLQYSNFHKYLNKIVLLITALNALLSTMLTSVASTKLSPVTSVLTYPLSELNEALSVSLKSDASIVPSD
ncbi:MAG: hypothetical protein IPP52_16030 [Ignavibacteria bacterium]|nr:hypothetical protein [Ignavibacteria bacterium]